MLSKQEDELLAGFYLFSSTIHKCIESSFLRRNVHRMIKMSLGMKNELPKRILIIHVARVSHQVFASTASCIERFHLLHQPLVSTLKPRHQQFFLNHKMGYIILLAGMSVMPTATERFTIVSLYL